MSRLSQLGVICATALAAVAMVTSPTQAGDEPYCTIHPEDVKQCPPLPPGLLACLTGIEPAQLPAPPLPSLPSGQGAPAKIEVGRQGVVAHPNGRWAVNTNDGLIAFVPAFARASSRVGLLPTARGVRANFGPGVASAGRYVWKVRLASGDRLVRRKRSIELLTERHRMMRLILCNSAGKAQRTHPARRRARRAQTEDDPPGAGVTDEGDGVFVDTPGTAVSTLDASPIGEPDPIDCQSLATPGAGAGDPPPSSDVGATAALNFDGSGAVARAKRMTRTSQLALRCAMNVYYPFRSGGGPSYENGRMDALCDPRIRVLLRTQRARIKIFVGPGYKTRRLREAGYPATYARRVTTAATRCRSTAALRLWRTDARLSVVALAAPYVGSVARHTTGIYDYCT